SSTSGATSGATCGATSGATCGATCGALCASGQPSTVNDHGGPCDEGGLVGAEPGDGGSDLLRPAEAMHGDGSGEPVASLIGQLHEPVGEDGAWGDGVDTDIALGILQCCALSQADDTMFGGDIAGDTWHAAEPGSGRHVDDGPTTAGEHGRDLELQSEEDA